MNRKKFLKNAFLTGVAGAVAPQIISAKYKTSTPAAVTLSEQVGFNHLPIK